MREKKRKEAKTRKTDQRKITKWITKGKCTKNTDAK